LGSGGYECPSCGFGSKCPICGSKVVKLEYRGHKRSILDIIESDGFVCLLGCCRVDLHDKVIDGVNYRGKVFVKPVFSANGATTERHEQGSE